MKQSKSLIKTRRLLYWAYQVSFIIKYCVNVSSNNGVHNSFHGINLQVSRGLRHLAEQGILHRDIALRNILLTNNDVVKVRHDDGDDHDDDDHHPLQQ